MSEAEDKYKPIKIERTSDLIVKEIWNLILNGELKPGDKLPSERELVKKFEVSKVTIREALYKLQTYGHITKKRGQNGGSIVLDIVPEQGINVLLDYLNLKKYSIEQLIESRSMIEPLIARQAAEKATPEDIEKIRENLAIHEKDYQERGCSKTGWQFYLLLAKCTKNEIFLIIEELLIRTVLDTEFSLGISDLESSERQQKYDTLTFEGQKKVAEAVIHKDPERAEREMRELRENWAQLITEMK
ncbi:MAG: FadR/GntR family transcriptional regulator [Spirochaetaceae bacterium]